MASGPSWTLSAILAGVGESWVANGGFYGPERVYACSAECSVVGGVLEFRKGVRHVGFKIWACAGAFVWGSLLFLLRGSHLRLRTWRWLWRFRC